MKSKLKIVVLAVGVFVALLVAVILVRAWSVGADREAVEPVEIGDGVDEERAVEGGAISHGFARG